MRFIFLFTLFSFQLIGLQTMAQADNSHLVRKGETLYSIAKDHGVSVEQIAKANNLIGNAISIGQSLVIPKQATESKAVETQENGTFHVVQKGETLYQISKKYGLGVKQIQELNGLQGNEIQLGQRLKLPIAQEVIATDEPKTDQAKVKKKDKPTEDIETQLEMDRPPSDELVPNEGVSGDTLGEETYSAADSAMAEEAGDDFTSVKADIGKGDEIFMKLFRYYAGSGTPMFTHQGIATYVDQPQEKPSFFALYDGAQPGTVLRVRNMMNNQVVYVKVVGRVPKSDRDRDIFLKLSYVAAKKINVLDEKFIAEVTSYIKK